MTLDLSQTAAIVYRNGIVESTHRAHIAVVNASGRLLHGFNDPQRLTLVRSAAKPAQALAVIETGALERFGFDDADLALMCGSNSSEPRHIERARSMLAKVGADESAMRCGGHAPLSDAVWRDWIKRGFEPTPACSNCSGKHVGMLAAARMMGAPIDDYHAAGHPLQLRVKQTVAEICDMPDDGVQWGIDGCNLPTPAFPLDRLARLYAKLAQAADTDADALDARARALAHIYRAMTSHPELVAGEQRFCTTLMRAFGGELVGKVGADGSYAIGVRKSVLEHGNEAIGIAVKVEDGNLGALYAIVVAVLRELGIGTPGQLAALHTFDRPPIRNTMGVETGYLEVRGGLLNA
ncbi:L-asparaginase II [Paraburkholderia bannensis]|uniref:L-asparaginase II n=1 Tax=Paraburkholderia bannensis TaxID=765414 RepID=A0A7W9TWE4_9BURK|nr:MULTISPECIES: asparaginase [Paraburkholderia]MBB3257594.1 L-asparaginase II [Paraburkholderia sp. WP4_3_2]MBB6102607.1 L-asparaginase II [Paraburkholderia bannensis]